MVQLALGSDLAHGAAVGYSSSLALSGSRALGIALRVKMGPLPFRVEEACRRGDGSIKLA